MEQLIAERLRSDPRIQESLRRIESVLAEYRGELGRQEAEPALAKRYGATIERFGHERGGSLYYDYLGSGIGNGPYVELADGSVKLDFIIGIGVHILGHNHPRLVRAHLEAALRNTTMQGNLQQNLEAVEFTERLLRMAGESGAALEHCLLTTSGAMANENALKICFQKRFPARRVLAFSRCFAGRTLALSQVTDKPAFRDGLPPTIATDYVPFFRPDEPRSAELSVEHLRRHIARHPGDHAAMVLELVQGEGGFNAGSRDFFRPICEELRRHEIPILIDEVQTFGRTTRPFAFQHFDLDEFVDVVTVGKCTQVCATLYRHDFQPKPGLLSQTFTGSTSAIMAGTAVLEELATGGYYGPAGKIAYLNEAFGRLVGGLANKHPDRVRGPFGIGAMVALQVFDGSLERTKSFARQLFDQGLLAFTAGSTPHARIRFLLPFAGMDATHLEEAGRILDEALSTDG